MPARLVATDLRFRRQVNIVCSFVFAGVRTRGLRGAAALGCGFPGLADVVVGGCRSIGRVVFVGALADGRGGFSGVIHSSAYAAFGFTGRRLVAFAVVRASLSRQCVGRESAPSGRGRGSFWAAHFLRVGRVAYDSSRRKMNIGLVAFSSTKRALAHPSFLLAAVRRVVGILAVFCGGKCRGKASAKRMHNSPG